jgi:hypothetical protein
MKMCLLRRMCLAVQKVHWLRKESFGCGSPFDTSGRTGLTVFDTVGRTGLTVFDTVGRTRLTVRAEVSKHEHVAEPSSQQRNNSSQTCISTRPRNKVTNRGTVTPANAVGQNAMEGLDTGLRRYPDRSRRIRLSGTVVSSLLLLLTCLPLFLCSCDYGRMKDDEAIHTYETTLPNMPQKTVPTAGGVEAIRETKPQDLINPLPRNPEVVERGKERYGFYCTQCHGPKGDGDGTVGQSFAPLPTHLLRRYVQKQSDGELFVKISLGFRRHPPLAATVAEEDRWAIIHYLRAQAGAQRVSSRPAE